MLTRRRVQVNSYRSLGVTRSKPLPMAPMNLTRFIWLSIAAAVLSIALKATGYFLTSSVRLVAAEQIITPLAYPPERGTTSSNTSDAQQPNIYTMYSPPHHCDGAVHTMENDAETGNEEFDGTTTE